MLAELFAGRVRSFDDSIGVEHQQVTLLQPLRALFEAGPRQQAENRTAIAESQNTFAAVAEQQRSAVAAIDVVQQSRGSVEIPPEQTGEPLLGSALAQEPVELFGGSVVIRCGTSPVRGVGRPLNQAG